MPETKAKNAGSLPTATSLLDDTNRRLLDLLTADPQLSTAALARQLKMSAPAVRDRLARLRESGVIRGVRLDIDPAALGLPVAAPHHRRHPSCP